MFMIPNENLLIKAQNRFYFSLKKLYVVDYNITYTMFRVIFGNASVHQKGNTFLKAITDFFLIHFLLEI